MGKDRVQEVIQVFYLYKNNVRETGEVHRKHQINLPIAEMLYKLKPLSSKVSQAHSQDHPNN